jgi:hypothetical protein
MRDEMSTSLAKAETKLRSFGDGVNKGQMQIPGLEQGLKRTTAEMKKFGNETDSTTRKVNEANRSFGRLRSVIASLRSHIRAQKDDIKGLRSEWNDLERNIRRADTRFREAIIAMSAANLQGVLSAVIGLGGALVAVAGSAEQAAFALAGALTAAAAQAIPAVGLLSVAMFRLKAIFDVIKQSQLLQQQQSAQGEQVHRREANRVNSLANAYDTLKNAHVGVINAQRNLTNARREAARQLQDLILQEQNARLAAEGAVLSQEQAQRALRQAISSGDVNEIAQRQLDVRQAGLERRTSGIAATRAAEDRQRLTPGGVEGQENVVNAREQLASATRAVTQARRGITEAKRHVDEAGDAALAAAGKLKFLESQLSSTELRTYRTFRRIYALYQDPKGPIRGITDILTSAFNDFALNIEKTLRNPRFIGSFRTLAGQMAGQFRRLTGQLFDPKVIGQFTKLTSESGKNLKPITTIIINLFRSFLNIAEAASPLLSHILEKIKGWSSEFRKMTGDHDKTSKFFENAEKHFDGWIGLIGAALKLMQALFDAGSGTGLRIVKALTRSMNEATDFIQKHPGRVRKFFGDVFEVMKTLGSLAKALGGTLLAIFRPENAKAFGGFLEKIVIPGMKNAIIIAGAIAEVLTTISENPVLAFIERMGVAMLFLNTIFLGFPKFILTRVIPSMFGFGAAANANTAAITTLTFANRALTISFLGWVGIVAIIVAALIYLQIKFHIFNKLWDLIKKGAQIVLNFFKEHWKDALIVLITGPFGIIILLVKRHWKAISRVFSGAMRAIGRGLSAAWEGIKDIFKIALGGILDFVTGIGDTIVGIFSDIGNGIGDAFKTGLGFAYSIIATFINGAVSAFNTVGGALNKILPGSPIKHTDFHLPGTLEELQQQRVSKRQLSLSNRGISDVGMGAPAPVVIPDSAFGGDAASGRMVGAMPGGRIFRVGEGGYDEVILSTDPKHRERTANLLGQFLGKMGNFARGGWVNRLPSQVGLSGVSLGVLQGARAILDRFPGLIITSGTGGNHARNSFHYRGDAVDIGGPQGVMDQAARWARGAIGGSLAEGIHNPGLSIKYGKDVPSGFWGANTWAAHRNHIHIAIAGALGAIADVGRTIRGGLRDVNTDRAGIFGPLINAIRRGARRGLEKLANSSAGDTVDTPTGRVGTGFAAIRDTAHKMVRQFFGEREWPAFDALEMQEAGYNPFARNPDSGAFGIPQALPPGKLNAAARAGNPVEQLKWMLQYIKDRYGTPSNAWAGYWGRGGWYERGGELPGGDGTPLPIVAHAGEWILNKMQQSKVASAMGTTRDRLKGFLGFTGGPTHFQGGGDVGERIRRATTIRGESPDSVLESLTVTSRLLRLLRVFNKNGTKFGKVLGRLADELSTLSTNMDNEQKRAQVRFQRLSLHMRKNGIVIKENAVKLAELQLLQLGEDRRNLISARGVATRTRNQINRRIARLRRGGISDEERPEFERLVAGRNSARATITDINSKIAQNLSDIYDKQQEVFQAQIDSATKGNATRTRAIELGRRLASALGNRGDQRGFQQQIIDNAADQINTLKHFLDMAKLQGNVDLAETLQTQIDDLNATIVETTAELLQGSIDEVNNAAQRAQTAAERRNRIAGIIQAAGDPLRAAGIRLSALGDVGTALSNQRTGLSALLGQAFATGNVGAVESLTDQIADLDIAIQENSQAQRDSITAMNQVSIDLIRSAAQFRTGIFGSLQNIVNAVGALSGNIDTNELRKLITATIVTLTGAGQGLAGELLRVFGINLTGLHGIDLVRAIEQLNISGIEANMSEAERQQFEGLIQSIIENESALLQNTQQLSELNSTLVQSFSSDQWLAFRQAIFNGAGGLMPQFQFAVPALDAGGVIERSGLAYVHVGEEVISKARRGTSGVEKFEQTINITEPMEVADPIYLANKIAFETSLGKVNQ